MIATLSPAIARDLFRQGRTLLGLDLGTRTIGLASATIGTGLVTPMRTLRRVRFQIDAAAILASARETGAHALVLGLPLNADGTAGARVQATRGFAHHLAKLTPMPIVLADERYSSVEAEDRLRAEGRPAREREGLIDAMAAAIILEDAIATAAQLTARDSRP